jgi:hypothetical protein
MFQITQHVTSIAVADNGSSRNLDQEVLASATKAIGSLTMFSARRFPVPLVRKMSQIGVAIRGAKYDVPAFAAVAAVGAALRGVLFAPEAEAAVASISPSNEYRHAVDEHENC